MLNWEDIADSIYSVSVQMPTLGVWIGFGIVL